jgi:hypothetical protein
MKSNWREATSDVLAEIIGPASGIIIELALKKLPVNDQKMLRSRSYLNFLKELEKFLPGDSKPKAICEKIWLEMLNKNIIT